MNTENRFNLIDEPWIPIVDVGRASLKQVFSNPNYRALGGNPVQKIALTKLLLAIAQSAYTPVDDEDWSNLGANGMAEKCLKYLEKWRDCFWLYGEKPFLQMPAIEDLINKKKTLELTKVKNKNKRKKIEEEAVKSIGQWFYPDVQVDNKTILNQCQFDRLLSDAEKALFIVSLMNFALGGKRVEKNLDPLTPGYHGKTASAKAAPSIGYVGYLHTYFNGQSLLDTIWFNLLTMENIEEKKIWISKLGAPPWEAMPEGEECAIAKQLKNSYMGCLVAMSRFVLLKEKGIYYVEGIQYPSHKDGWREPSIAINNQGKNIKLLWVDPNQRPWRELVSLLAFISIREQTGGYYCQQIKCGLNRIAQYVKSQSEIFSIWSGGLKVSSNSGEQAPKGNDDFVESNIFLSSKCLGDFWYEKLKNEMSELNRLSTIVYSVTKDYFKNQNLDGKKQAKLASSLFWQLCERKFQDLVNVCGITDNLEKQKSELKKMRRIFAKHIYKAYDSFCPKETVRQLDAWAKYRPELRSYLKNK